MPADHPEVVVYVAIDNPKGVVQYGGTVAAPIAKTVLEGITDVMDIKKSTSEITREYELWDTKYYQVPNVTGMDKVSARKALSEHFSVEYSGTGDNVIYQSPEEFAYVKEGGTVKLMLN